MKRTTIWHRGMAFMFFVSTMLFMGCSEQPDYLFVSKPVEPLLRVGFSTGDGIIAVGQSDTLLAVYLAAEGADISVYEYTVIVNAQILHRGSLKLIRIMAENIDITQGILVNFESSQCLSGPCEMKIVLHGLRDALPPIKAGCKRQVYVIAEVGQAGNAVLGDVFSVGLELRASTVGGDSVTVQRRAMGSDFQIVPQIVELKPVYPLQAIDAGTGTGVLVAQFQVLNHGSAVVVMDKIVMGVGGQFSNPGFDLQASADGGSKLDNSIVWVSDQQSFALIEATDANATVSGMSWRYCGIYTHRPVNAGDRLYVMIMKAEYSVRETDLGYDGNRDGVVGIDTVIPNLRALPAGQFGDVSFH